MYFENTIFSKEARKNHCSSSIATTSFIHKIFFQIPLVVRVLSEFGGERGIRPHFIRRVGEIIIELNFDFNLAVAFSSTCAPTPVAFFFVCASFQFRPLTNFSDDRRVRASPALAHYLASKCSEV